MFLAQICRKRAYVDVMMFFTKAQFLSMFRTKDDDKKEPESEQNKDSYAEWYLSFYGEPPESSVQPPIIPPPPDIMPTVNYAAHYVAKYGSRAEQHIAREKLYKIYFDICRQYLTVPVIFSWLHLVIWVYGLFVSERKGMPMHHFYQVIH